MGERRADVRGHIVRTFQGMAISLARLRHKPLEEIAQIERHVRIGIFLNSERARGVLNENGQQSVCDRLFGKPIFDRARKNIEAFAARQNGKRGMGELQSARLFHSYAFREIARLVHIAAAAHRNVIGQQLQRNHLEQRQK